MSLERRVNERKDDLQQELKEFLTDALDLGPVGG